MIAVDSRVDAVTIYHRGATVTRLLTVEAGADGFPETIEIPGLPLSLSDVSARLSVRGVDGGEVVAAELRVGLHARPESELPPEPDREALKAAERDLGMQRDLLAQIEQEIGLLTAIPVPARPSGKEDEEPPPSPLAARVALEDFTDGAVRARQEEARAIRAVIREREEEVAELRDQLRRRSSAQTAKAERITKTVVATLRRGGAVTRAELALEYFVPGCMWAPRYQVRVSRGGDKASLSMRALVAQGSGEDWRGVKLTLSTADPFGWTELPKLSSIRIGKAQAPPQQRGFREPPEGAGALFGDWERDRRKLTVTAPGRPPEAPPASTHVDMPDLRPLALMLVAAPTAEPPAESYMEPEPMMMGGGGFTAGSAMSEEMAMARPAPAPKMARRRRSSSLKQKKGGRADKAMVERSLRAESAAFDDLADEGEDTYGGAGGQPAFSMLRLEGPRSRGRLSPVDTRSVWRELLNRSGLTVNFSLDELVRSAVARAASVGDLSLPAGTWDVRKAAASFDYAYPTESRVDVPSDGAFHSVPVGDREADCELRYVVVPREDTNVFRIATLVNPTHEPVLPGPVEVYVGGEYVVTAALPAVGPRARFRLGLGVEQAIKCARNTRFEEKRSGAAVVATAELWHELDITLVNGLGQPIECEVRERIPQPAENAEVVVEEGAVSPDWSAYDQEERRAKIVGGRRWTVTIAAGAEQKLSAKYVVKIYANNEVVGGNRREA